MAQHMHQVTATTWLSDWDDIIQVVFDHENVSLTMHTKYGFAHTTSDPEFINKVCTYKSVKCPWELTEENE
jgi:hypothetical protein